jgi:uncharacterized protein with GYD domain
MIVGSYTADSWARMIDNPGDRAAVARDACDGVGGRLEAFYWAFGPDDLVAITDLPDDASAAAIGVALASTGAMHGIRTTRLITMDEARPTLEKARRVAAGYRRPGES